MLCGLGVDAVITQPFTAELAAIEAEDFLPWLVRALPHLTAVYVGENFRFGRGRHKAALNFGDCLSYATASVGGDSLLFVGADFRLTDIPAAL